LIEEEKGIPYERLPHFTSPKKLVEIEIDKLAATQLGPVRSRRV
jgi:hypothetical protein